MSNNVPAKIKPIGILQDFSVTHLGHYETFLHGRVGTIWDNARLFSGKLTNCFVKDGKIFLQARCASVSLSPRVDLGAVVF